MTDLKITNKSIDAAMGALPIFWDVHTYQDGSIRVEVMDLARIRDYVARALERAQQSEGETL